MWTSLTQQTCDISKTHKIYFMLYIYITSNVKSYYIVRFYAMPTVDILYIDNARYTNHYVIWHNISKSEFTYFISIEYKLPITKLLYNANYQLLKCYIIIPIDSKTII